MKVLVVYPHLKATAVAIGISLAILGAGIAWWVLGTASSGQGERTERADGTVVAADARSEGRVEVKFTANDGKEYRVSGEKEAAWPNDEVGDLVTVAYNPDNPADARVGKQRRDVTGPLFVTGFGGLILVLSLVALVSARHKAALRRQLREHGHQIWVPVAHTQVVPRTSTDFDTGEVTTLYYTVRAFWVFPPTGRTCTADSEDFKVDPTPELRRRTHVKVLYDSVNPSRGVVEFAEEPAVEL
ncbi:DUF3592 domain-containing protein [Nocardia sp. NPDC052566]|uniref:DUF3592 domain-containing protein n=1 Tax=Nocardia sp. NPDC052566 TaxID=3364330 RepID=UPI0037C7B382